MIYFEERGLSGIEHDSHARIHRERRSARFMSVDDELRNASAREIARSDDGRKASRDDPHARRTDPRVPFRTDLAQLGLASVAELDVQAPPAIAGTMLI